MLQHMSAEKLLAQFVKRRHEGEDESQPTCKETCVAQTEHLYPAAAQHSSHVEEEE